MSRHAHYLVEVGGTPAVDLLPYLERQRIERRPVVRRIVAGVLVLAMTVGALVVGATLLAADAENRLAAERARTDVLLAQQLEFDDIRAKDATIREVGEARGAVTAGETDWEALLAEIRGVLPAGVVLTSVSGQITSPAEFGALSDAGSGSEAPAAEPLREDSIGSFRIIALSPTVPDVQDWLKRLETITGFAGIAPPISVLGDDQTQYTVTIEVLLNESAYLGRYAVDSPASDEEN